jgi:hypothetical protein
VGLGLSAFFWLPAFANRDWVFGLASSADSVAYFTHQLRPTTELIQRTFYFQQHDHGFERLGLVQLGLTAVGLLIALRTTGRARPVLALFGLLVLGFSLGMSSLARPFWEAMPFVTLMQDPFRLGLTISTGTAVLIGGLLRLRQRWLGWLLGVAATTVLATSTLGALSPSLAHLRPDVVNSGSFARMEMFATYPEIGTVVPVSQFLPRWVSSDPATYDRSLTRDPAEPTPAVPAQVSVESVLPGHYWLKARASAPFSFLLHNFYVPAWSARVDGQPVSVGPFGDRGLASVPVPAGEHSLELWLGQDQALTVGTITSILSLVAVVGLLVGRSKPVTLLLAIALGTVAGGVFVAGSRTARLAGAVQPAALHYSNGIDLAGWSARPSTTSSGTELNVDLYWFTQQAMSVDDEVTLKLTDSTGLVRATYHKQPHWGSTPTSTWQASELVHDEHVVLLPGGLAPGTYQLEVGMGRPADAPSIVQTVGTISLGASESPVAPRPSHSIRAEFADGLALVGYDVAGIAPGPRLSVQPGNEVAVRLYWEVVDDPSQDEVVSVFLADDQGNKLGVQDTYPPHDLEYTAAWRKGSHHVQDFTIPVPLDLSTGKYALAIEVYGLENGQRQLIERGSAGVGTTRASLLSLKRAAQIQPIVPARFEVEFDNEVALVGHDVSLGPDRAVHLTLHWQAVTTPRQDYTVFAHLVDASGKLVAQHDGPPRSGSYPTSIWDGGEVVDDELTIDPPSAVKSGTYALEIGLYEPSTGRRLPLASGGDSATIGTVQLP